MSELDKKKVIRNIVAVVGGLLIATIIAALVEKLGHSIWAPPVVDPNSSPEAVSAAYVSYLKIAPLGAILMVAIAHFVGIMAGVGFAFKIQRDFKMAGIIVGAIYLFLAIIMLVMITHPFWFMIVDLVAIVIGIVIPWRMLKS